MRVFVTGGTGYIGREVVRALVDHGHRVTVLNRSPEKDALLRDLGARSLRGDIGEPGTYAEEAAEHDALVHAAFQPSGEAVAADRTAVETLLEAATSGRPRSVLYTSGCWTVGDTGGGTADETVPADAPAEVVEWRVAHERRVLEAADGEVATAVLRPGMVYGGHSSLTGLLCFRPAEEEGAATFVGDGENHWSMVYRGDLARLYLLIVEERAAGVYHGVDGHPVRAVDIARAASEAAGAGGAVRGIPLDEARERLGLVADALALDQLLVAPRSAELGWRPDHPSFPETAEKAYREWQECRA